VRADEGISLGATRKCEGIPLSIKGGASSAEPRLVKGTATKGTETGWMVEGHGVERGGERGCP